MKPAKSSVPVQKDPNVTKRCTKLAQLQMLIYHWKVECERIDFQRELLHDFFNPRINNAIEKFREHMGKIQAMSLKDYDFIVERTRLFYEHKCKRLDREIRTASEQMEAYRTSKNTEVEQLISETNSIISEIQKQLDDSESTFAQLCEDAMQSLKRNTDLARQKNQKEIEDCEREYQERIRREERDSEERCRKLAKEHKQNMNDVTDSFHTMMKDPFDRQKIASLRNNKLKEQLNTLVEAFKEMINRQKQEFTKIYDDLIQDEKAGSHDAESLQEKLRQVDERYTGVIEQLLEEQRARKSQHEAEILNEQCRLDTLKNSFKADLENAERSVEAAVHEGEAKLRELEQKLSEEKRQRELKIADEQRVEEERITGAASNTTENQCLIGNLDSLKLENQKKQTLCLEKFLSQKKMAIEANEAEKKSVRDKHDLIQAKTTDAIETHTKELESLKPAKEAMGMEHRQALSICDQEEAQEVEALKTIFTQSMNEIEQKQVEELSNLEKLRCDLILAKKTTHEKECEQFRENLAQKQQRELDSIKLSETELRDIEDEYKHKHVELEAALEMYDNSTPEDLVTKMEEIINQLNKDLRDRETEIASQRTTIIDEWQQSLVAENDRHEQHLSLHGQVQNRDSEIQALQQQIECVKNARTAEEESLTTELTSLSQSPQVIPPGALDTDLDNETKELREILCDEQRKATATIRAKEAQFTEEIGKVAALVQKKSREWNDQREAIIREQDVSNESFRKEASILNQKIQAILNEANSRYSAIQIQGEAAINASSEQHRKATLSLTRKCDSQRDANSVGLSLFEEKLDVLANSSSEKIEALADEFAKTLEKLRAEKVVRLELLEERLKYAEERCQRIKKELQYNPKVGRPQDIESIERLQFILHTKKSQFSNMVKELSQCKILYVQQEKRCDVKLPDVSGRMSFHQKHRNPAMA